MPTIDYPSDPTKTGLYAIAQEYELPGFVKEAAPEDLVPGADCPLGRAYALPRRKALPVHTKSAAWLSAAYLAKYGQALPDFERQLASRRIEAMLDFFGLALPAPKAAAAQPEPREEDYLICLEKEGQTLRRLPVRHVGEVKVAVSYLHEHRLELPTDVRRQASANLLKKAQELRYPLALEDRQRLELDAGDGLMYPETLADTLHKRAILALRLGQLEDADTLAKSARGLYDSDDILVSEDVAQAAVVALEEFDQRVGLPKGAATGLYAMTNSQAQELAEAACCLANGSVYDGRDFGQLKLAHVQAALGEEIGSRVADSLFVDSAKAAQVFATLSSGQADRVDQICQRGGVVRLAKLAGRAVGLTPGELQLLSGY